MSPIRKHTFLTYLTITFLLTTFIQCDGVTGGRDRADHNKLDAAGIVGIILAALAFLIGLGLILYCCCLPRAEVVPPVVTDSAVVMPVTTPAVVAPPQPIIIDNARPTIPCPMIEPIPQPMLPPPKPVVPVPQAVPVVAVPQPVVTQVPVTTVV